MTEKKTNAIVNAENVNIKVPGEAIDKKSAELLGKALGFAAEETGGLLGDFVGMFGDRMRARRQVNRVKILQSTHQELDALGVSIDDINTISLGEVERVLIDGSDADDDQHQKMWSALFASALDPNSETTVSPAFASVLSEMDGWDARAFKVIAEFPDLFSNLSGRMMRASHEYLRNNPDIKEEYSTIEKVVFDNVHVHFTDEREALLALLDTTFPVSEAARLGAVKLNLTRLQLIEPLQKVTSSSQPMQFGARDQESAVNRLWKLRHEDEERSRVAEFARHNALFEHPRPPFPFQCSFELSEFGKSLAESCGLNTRPDPKVENSFFGGQTV